MQIRGYDYILDRLEEGVGLANLSNAIATARREISGAACLLVDNGDTLQGSALSSVIDIQNETHPMAAAMNRLGYDVLGLGNHDFDYGLEYLDKFANQVAAPVISSNYESDQTPNVIGHAIVEKSAVGTKGDTHQIKIGVLSVLPVQTLVWNQAQLNGAAQITNMQNAAARTSIMLRQSGADVIILLAHSGIGTSTGTGYDENAALSLAKSIDVDAIVAGHTHILFPDILMAKNTDIDPIKGTLAGVPVASPGYAGSHLGVIDLDLSRNSCGRWDVTHKHTDLRTPALHSSSDPAIMGLSDAKHQATLDYLSRPIGQTHTDINSFFSLLGSSADTNLVGQALQFAVQSGNVGHVPETLPVIACVAPTTCGGYRGPSNYIDIPKGTFQQRHLMGLSPYENTIWALVLNGRQIKEWIERSAAIYHQISWDTADQVLVDEGAPPFNFDVAYGLEYQIDPTQKPRYCRHGTFNPSNEGRVKNVLWQNNPVKDSQEFLVATTSYRAAGGGSYPGANHENVLVQTDITAHEALNSFLAQKPFLDRTNAPKSWCVSSGGSCPIIYQTSPNAAVHLDQFDHYRPENLGLNEDGFLQLRLYI